MSNEKNPAEALKAKNLLKLLAIWTINAWLEREGATVFNLSFFEKKNSILISCAKELPVYVKQELSRLGFPVGSETLASVETEGTLSDAMILNLKLRTAGHVLYKISGFPATDPVGLYKEIKKIRANLRYTANNLCSYTHPVGME